jgi:hypothetical protein
MLTASFGTQVVWLKADVIVGAGPEAWLDDVDCVVHGSGTVANALEMGTL